MLCLKKASNLQRCVQVEWEDGLLAKFSYIWLRDNARRRPSLIHLDLNTQPQEIKCSKEALEVQWPPFVASKYTSTFLRENALQNNHLNKTLLKANTSALSSVEKQRHAILDSARMSSLDESLALGTCYWEDYAQEPGTVWPHLSSVPSTVTIETMNGPAQISIVDTCKALSQLRERSPQEFNFLASSVLEYKGGLYRSRHSIVSIDEEGNIQSGVFNNAARSSTITVESLDRLYECLQKFGRVCAENTQIMTLMPGQRLIFNNKEGMLGAPAQRGRLLMLKCFT
ncbi:hypothetical protein ACQ4LE_006881 [Meloidogyne hapla]|uniref:HSac2 domain-containing protein n=1 Tax=Meloidogyne hapla TaxID=6305 RepID=A0A1I8BIU0_MELHA